jgi:hypothetical protein
MVSTSALTPEESKASGSFVNNFGTSQLTFQGAGPFKARLEAVAQLGSATEAPHSPRERIGAEQT